MVKNLLLIFKDIKVEHTIFAMPFAISAAFMAADGLPHWLTLLLLLTALFFARSAAMAFNRISDARFDSTNPRTESRPLASGQADGRDYIAFLVGSSALFIATCWFINQLAFYLSPLALLIIFFYSITKRFTRYSHLFLGIALAIAPVGAWVAVTGSISNSSMLLGAAVVFWLVGLDVIYSCQDVEHDKNMGLHSIPSRLGIKKALLLSKISHALMIISLLVLYVVAGNLGFIYLAGVAATAAMLWYEHSLVSSTDLSRVNVAFFNMNGVISIGLMIFVVADILL